MSEPSIQNIDKWMFELHEGNLSPAQEKMLMDFIAVHPELSADLDAWKMASVEADPVAFDTQALLKDKRKIAPVYWGVLSAFVLGLGASAWLFLSDESKATYASKDLDLTIQNDAFRTGLLSQVQTEDVTPSISLNKGENSAQEIQSNLSYTNPQRTINRSFLEDQFHFVNREEVVLDASTSSELQTTNQQQFEERLSQIVATLDDEERKVTSSNDRAANDFESSSNTPNSKVNHNAQHSSSNKRAFTLKRALYEFSRDVKRTMNNPVALKNYRDQYYSLPSATGFAVNPGMVGTQVAPKIQWATRGQYLGTSSSQISNRLSFDTYVYELKGGIGVDLNHSTIDNGAVQTMEGAFTYSPKISLGEKFSLEPALRFRFGNKQIDADKLVMGSVIELDRGRPLQFFEEGQTPTGQSLWYRDVQAGFLLNTPWFYAGASIDNVGRHFNNIYSNDLSSDFKASPFYQAQIGTDYKSLSKKTVLSTYAIYQQQGSWNELWVGANIKFKGAHFGGAISNDFDPALSLGVDAKRVRFIYNADYSRSQIDSKKYLCHQLTLRYKLKPNRNARRILNM
ncbi:PorP/SprF family type IX secretion system membrane protein [Lishizhenia sp.]|uniref:PorP/SprF family type IX secretion system membrane protein n=1 Tax=Lishizhenia sp. TaxID=2497594 RepID=UPI00299EF134|nr:PorP/SprF family type IX secretion system membrane protein [Lishizhenia sp.]MDX1447130.1 PorP/SprF family type IX secretion system membrane protein [Lishizhenia sp.]